MAVLASFFGNAQDQAQDSDKLMHLFWNRTELKKEFARLRNEKYRLGDQIKQQESLTARANQNLEHLEHMLGDPATALNVLVHYQLRGLGQRCEGKVARFAEELKQQRERKQRNLELMAWNDERGRQRKFTERKLATCQESAEQMQSRLRVEEQRVNALGFFQKLLKRRTLNAKLDFMRRKIAKYRADEAELEGKLDMIKNQRPPENSGLDVATKRLINLKIIAYAQHLYLELGGGDLAIMVKQTMDRSAGGVEYGDKAKCDQLLACVAKLAAKIERNESLGGVLEKRAELIGQTAKFHNDSDVVPITNSVATLYAFNKKGAVTESECNLLGENYWGIAKALSR